MNDENTQETKKWFHGQPNGNNDTYSQDKLGFRSEDDFNITQELTRFNSETHLEIWQRRHTAFTIDRTAADIRET